MTVTGPSPHDGGAVVEWWTGRGGLEGKDSRKTKQR